MTSVSRALKSGHWPSLVGAWVHFEVSFMVWLLLGALSIGIAEEFGLTATQKGLLVAVPILSGALLRIPIGWCSDRFGPRWTGVLVLAGEFVALLHGWFATGSFVQSLVTGLLLGAAAASFAVALPLACRVYPPLHQGFAMGVAASGNSGAVLAMFFAPRLAEMVGWRGVFGLMAIPIVMTMVLFLTVVRCDPPVLSDHSRDWLTPTKELLRRPAFYWLSAVYGVTFGGFVGFCSALPVFLYDQYRIDQVTAGAIAALCGLTGSVMRPVGGYTADSIGGLKVLQAVLPLVGGLTLAIGRLPTMAWMVVLTVCAVAVMGFGNGVVFQIVSDWYRKQIGAAAGLIGAAGGIGGFLFPFWLGFLKDVTGTFRVGFWVFAVGAFIAGLSVVVMRHGEGRTHGT